MSADRSGHINVASGHGEWREDFDLLRDIGERAVAGGTVHAALAQDDTQCSFAAC